jgi:YegS/Rv2252/BmrU family lipid kinase
LAAEAGERLVVAVGGDGTAHEVVNGLLRRRSARPPRFGALMVGTGTDLRRTLPGPHRPEEVAPWLLSDRFRRIDVGRVGTSQGRRFFVNAADCGIGAEVARRQDRLPAWLGGTPSFLLAALTCLLMHRNREARLRIDEGPVEEWVVRSIAVANCRWFGGGMQIAPRAEPDDGLLDVCVIGDVSRWLGIRSLPLLYRGQHDRLAQVRFARAKRIEVDAPAPLGVEADGELVGETPAVFEIVPQALDVIRWP